MADPVPTRTTWPLPPYGVRRRLLLGAALALPALHPAAAAPRDPKRRPGVTGPAPLHAFVGSRAAPQRRGPAEGITTFRVDRESGAWTLLHRHADVANPACLVPARDGRHLYAVHREEEHATVLAVDPATGRLRAVGRATTGGRDGVRAVLGPEGRHLVVANAGGGVAVLPVAEDGPLRDHAQVVALPGEPGPHRAEQAGSHPHDVLFSPDGRHLVVPDKGLDRIFVLAWNAEAGTLRLVGSVATRAGAGPHRVAFHPTRQALWAANALDSTVTTYRWDPQEGALTPLQVMTTLPPDFTGDSRAGALAVSPDGRSLWCSNRGHDSVAIYSTQGQYGVLLPVGWESSQGRGPGSIALGPGGRFLYAANEGGDGVTAFRVEARTGRLNPTGSHAAVRSPVAIAFVGPA